MDTLRLRETLQAELERLARTREELRLQASLAKAETRTELNRLESVWQRVQDELRRLGEQAKAPAAEIGGAARSLVEELAQGYGRIKRELEDASLNNVASRSISALAAAAAQRDPNSVEQPAADAERAAVDGPFMRAFERVAQQIGARADARAVFANPVTKDGVTVIPVARVFGGFGAGAAQDAASGTGLGGGGGFGATPVGFIEIDRDGARFRRIDSPVESWFDVATTGFDIARKAGVWALAAYRRRRARKS